MLPSAPVPAQALIVWNGKGRCHLHSLFPFIDAFLVQLSPLPPPIMNDFHSGSLLWSVCMCVWGGTIYVPSPLPETPGAQCALEIRLF